MLIQLCIVNVTIISLLRWCRNGWPVHKLKGEFFFREWEADAELNLKDWWRHKHQLRVNGNSVLVLIEKIQIHEQLWNKKV